MNRFLTAVPILLILVFSGIGHAHRNGHGLPPDYKYQISHHHQKTDALIYREERVKFIKDGVYTSNAIYSKPDGTVVQKTSSVYHLDTLKLVSYRKEHLPTGKIEEMKVLGDKVEIRYRKQTGKAFETETLKWKDSFIFSNSIFDLIVRDWDKLEKGEKVAFDLLVPSRLETLVFRIAKEGEETVAGEKVSVVRMDPDSWIIRKLVDPLFFYVSASHPHKLMKYVGRSSVDTDEGKDQDLKTIYAYP